MCIVKGKLTAYVLCKYNFLQFSMHTMLSLNMKCMLLHYQSKLNIQRASNTRYDPTFVDLGPLEHPAFSIHATSPVYLILLQVFSLMKPSVWNRSVTKQSCCMHGPNKQPSSELHRSKYYSRSYKSVDILPTFWSPEFIILFKRAQHLSLLRTR